MHQLAATIVAGLLIIAADLTSSSASDGTRAATAISKHLAGLLPMDDDLERNMEAASRWKLELDPETDAKLVGAISTLEALHRAAREPTCNQAMYQTVDESARLVGYAIFDGRNDESEFTRTELMVRSAAHKIALLCQMRRSIELTAGLAELEPESLDRLEKLRKLSEPALASHWGRDICRYELNFPFLLLLVMSRMHPSNQLEFKYLRPVKNEAGEKLVAEDQVRQLVDLHISRPCRRLRQELGDSLDLARKDLDLDFTFSSRWLEEHKSELESLVQTNCLCSILTKVGDAALGQRAIALVPSLGEQ